jgi:hypothetical protein
VIWKTGFDFFHVTIASCFSGERGIGSVGGVRPGEFRVARPDPDPVEAALHRGSRGHRKEQAVLAWKGHQGNPEDDGEYPLSRQKQHGYPGEKDADAEDVAEYEPAGVQQSGSCRERVAERMGADEVIRRHPRYQERDYRQTDEKGGERGESEPLQKG